MEQQNSSFNGWCTIEIMGHSQAVGFCTTEYFGSACLFRVDTPALPERDYVLDKPQYVGGVWTPAGATVQRPASLARTKLLGPSSIFSLNPCTEELAMKAIEQIYPRELILLKMPERPQIGLPGEIAKHVIDPVCGLEIVIGLSQAITRQHGRGLFHFCSNGCAEEFMQDPESYLVETEEESE